MTTTTIAVWQCSPTPRDPDTNLERLRAVAADAVAQGARLLVTPEASTTGYDIGELTDDLHRDPEAVTRIAQEEGIGLVVGMLRRDDDGRWRNSSVLTDGVVTEVYDKAHLFAGLDRSRFAPGDRTHGSATLAGVRVATVICYDVEFPEPTRAAALDGAEVTLVPTANMHPFVAVNHLIVPARALENSVPVAYANHHGSEGGTRYVGRSLVAGADGSVLARAGEDGEELLVVEAELVARPDASDDPTGYLRDRRPELYGPLTSGGRP